MLNDCFNIADLRERARKRLPAPIFHFMDGGAESEATMRRNTSCFDDARIVPRCLTDVGAVDTSTQILGQNIEWPMMCSPTGASGLFHPDGELAVARAAAKSGILYGLSTGSSFSLEEVAGASSAPKFFQLYVYKDKALTRELIDRAKAAGYVALCITVDTALVGKRERDLRMGLSFPVKLSSKTIAHYLKRPGWLWNLRNGLPMGGNFRTKSGSGAEFAKRRNFGAFDTSLNWGDLAQIIERWQGPIVLKGVMSPVDARLAADHGVNVIVVSNHGGRQLDGAATPLDVLPDIAQTVGDRVDLILEGGVRRGVHILKALALGAKAVSIGRPYIYGLAAGGEAGVTKALDILRSELMLAMQLSGCPDIASINRSLVFPHHTLAR